MSSSIFSEKKKNSNSYLQQYCDCDFKGLKRFLFSFPSVLPLKM